MSEDARIEAAAQVLASRSRTIWKNMSEAARNSYRDMVIEVLDTYKEAGQDEESERCELITKRGEEYWKGRVQTLRLLALKAGSWEFEGDRYVFDAERVPKAGDVFLTDAMEPARTAIDWIPQYREGREPRPILRKEPEQ